MSRVQISVCCCALHAKYDVDIFVRALNYHNTDISFEICLAHDNRVTDGSLEHFEALALEFPNFKFKSYGNADLIDNFSRQLNYYEKNNLFDSTFRARLKANLEKIADGTFYDPAKSVLWRSSGVLYNRAVCMSTGKYIIVTPADFLYLFKLSDLVSYIKNTNTIYSKPNALFCNVSNQDRDWVMQRCAQAQQETPSDPRFPRRVPDFFRDHMRIPPKLEDLALVDVGANRITSLTDPDYMKNCTELCNRSAQTSELFLSREFHGFHAMSRSAYEQLGGFSEEYYGRAFADDKMSYNGRSRISSNCLLPPTYSVAWIGQYEYSYAQGKGYSADWQLQASQLDSYFDKKPMDPKAGAKYLDSDFQHELKNQTAINRVLNVTGLPVRLYSEDEQ